MENESQVALYFDPPSHHFLGDRLFDINYASTGGDKILAPYAYLKDYLNARGVTVRTADFLPVVGNGTRNVYISAGVLDKYRALAKRKDVVLSAFFAMECPTVEPATYRELNRAQHVIKRIFSWSDSASLEPFVGGPLRCHKLWWPQSFDGVHAGIWERTERGFLAMINGNKFPRYRSACRELYSERLKAVEYFSRTGRIEVYGVGWDGPRMIVGTPTVPGTFGRVPVPGTIQRIETAARKAWERWAPDPLLTAARTVYRGLAVSKSEVLGNYRFSICFENSILNGWITEKIFDCFFAGCVPVYWGAPDIENHVPADCFIDMRKFSSYADLSAHLHALTGRDVERYKENARAFLESPAFWPFTKRAFAERIASMIEEDTGVRLPDAGRP